MLELKRRVGQQVVIANDYKLTVIGMDASSVRLQLQAPGLDLTAPIRCGRSYEFDVNGSIVSVELRSIDRGEAALAFEAPRFVTIERPERGA